MADSQELLWTLYVQIFAVVCILDLAHLPLATLDKNGTVLDSPRLRKLKHHLGSYFYVVR